jgi:hypothetical protein
LLCHDFPKDVGVTKTNPVQASPFKGKSFWWELELPPKTRLLPPASCLLPSLTVVGKRCQLTDIICIHAVGVVIGIRLLAEVREQGTGNREQKEELRLKASKTLYF